MIAGDRRRDGKQQRDRSADEWRSGHGEGELSRAARGDPGDDPNDDPADHAGTAVERSEAHRDACEKGKRVDGMNSSQQKNPIPKMIPMIMMVVSATGHTVAPPPPPRRRR